MSKKQILTILLAAVLAITATAFAGCIKPDEIELPEFQPGSDSPVSGLTLSPEKYDPEMAVLASLGKLDSYATYKVTGKGVTVADKGIISYTQNTDTVAIKNGNEFYTDSVSDSSFVKVKHEAFLKNGKVAYRNDGGEILNTTEEDYASVYGVTPEKLMSGHVYNAQTIVFAQLVSSQNDRYEYTVVLDGNEATTLLVRQMKMLGGLSSLPVFTDNVVMTLVIGEDFTPVSLSYESKYSVSVAILGNMTCREEFELVFEDFGAAAEIPDTEAFNAAINETPSEIDSGEVRETDENLDAVVSALLNSDLGNGVIFNGSIDFGGAKLPFSVKGRVDVDEITQGTADLLSAFDAEFSVVTYAGELSVIYSQGKFYLNCMGGKYAFSVNEPSDEQLGNIRDNLKDADVSDFFTVERDEENPSLYRIILNEKYTGVIADVLSSVGLIEDRESLVLDIGAYIVNGRIGNIGMAFSTDKISEVTASVYLSDALYEDRSEEYFAEYLTSINYAVDSRISLLGFDLSGKIAVSYDTTQPDPKKAFELSAKYTVDSKKMNFGEVAAMFTSEVPEIVGKLDDAKTFELAVVNGEAYFVACDAEGNPVITEKLGGLDKLIPSLPKSGEREEGGEGEEGGLDESTALLIKTLINNGLVVSFEADEYYENKLIKISLADALTEMMTGMWNQLPMLVGMFAPDNEMLVGLMANEDFLGLLGFDRVFADLSAGIRIPYDENTDLVWKNAELYFRLSVYDVTPDEYDPEGYYEKVDVIYIGFSLSEEVPERAVSEATSKIIAEIAD